MKIIDYHVHSNNSFDGISSIKEICSNAIKRGIYEICFTEHFSVDSKDVSYNVLDYKKYHEEIKMCQDSFKDKLIIKEGLEIGEPHIPYLIDDINNHLRIMDLDFIIGSVHNINSVKLRTYMKDKSKSEIYEDYFKEIYELVQNSDIDVVGHLDLMKRYAYNTFGNYNFKDYQEIIRCILKKIIEKDIGIEINTSGFRNSVKESYPTIEILKLYKELGGEIITIGSDAHISEDVGNGYFSAIDMLKFLKFEKIFKYNKRKPMGIKIK
ncbi:histidinol-phosphatase HisJ family protein [Clostridioides difficile]